MLVHLTLAGNCVVTEERLLRHQLGRIRDVRLDANGVPIFSPTAVRERFTESSWRIARPARAARAGCRDRRAKRFLGRASGLMLPAARIRKQGSGCARICRSIKLDPDHDSPRIEANVPEPLNPSLNPGPTARLGLGR